MTNQQGAPEALRQIARYKIGYATDGWGMRSSTPSGIPHHAGAWVRYEDHVAALVEAQQPAPSAAETECVHEWDGLARTSMPPRYACKHCHNFFDAPPSPTPQAVSAPASVAGPMQFGGCPECGSRSCVARECSRTVSHAAQAIPGVQWQCGPQASGFTATQADSQPAPVRDYPPLPEPQYQMGGKGHSDAAMRAYVDADRAARAPADSVTAPAEESRCANCGKSAADSHERIADYPEEGEWFCSAQCKDQHDELDCPHLTHNGYRHPAESERLIACERALRSLASWLSVGGFNAPTVDAKVFEEKIRWGVEHLLQATPPAQAADSVLEDAARLLESQHTWLTNVAAANLVRSLAARKQGGKP